jgi:endonuclease/exonuclease/phosphatase family metal-dependent hydrolase
VTLARALACSLALSAAILASSCGGATTGPSSIERQQTFTVMTFNVQHGLDFAGSYDLQRAAEVIARVSPDLVAVQEITRNHPAYRCEDQPRVIAEKLGQLTGRQWQFIYQREWFTPDRSCVDGGRGDGPETEGLAFFAPRSIEGVTSLTLWNSALGYAARTQIIQGMVLTTHLVSGAARLNDRVRQLQELLPWAGTLGTPRVLMGDFNARPDAPEMAPVFGEYRDAWADAVAAGTARGVLSGDTRIRGGRIDYVLYTGDRLRVLDAEILDTAASDHRPVIVRFGAS